MRTLGQLELQRIARAGAHEEQPLPVLGYAMIRRVDQMRRHGIAEPAHRVFPCRVKRPVQEGRDVLHDNRLAAVILGAAHHGPRRTAQRVMVGALLAARGRMPLTRWRGELHVMARHLPPVGLLHVLAVGARPRVIRLMKGF